MPNIDISRDATDQRRHYDRVQMQQGRVLTDDDFNEAERLDAEDTRRVRVDVIGPAGSPDDGFRLKTATGQLVLSAGTFYVGGLRLEMESDEFFNLQKDWLQQGSRPDETLTAPAGEQFDFVWLDVWQQPVSAVEDKELFEAALSGADTSARIRTMRRARVLRNVGNVDCAAAWRQLLTSLNAEGTVNGDFELVPNATLTVGPDGTAGTEDLCSPPVSGGYLGAENQAIRVQIVGANQFTWGFDNGAPLYRVKLLPDSTGAFRRIHMLTVPKDQAHYPLGGQVVELLPWSALLSNGQKNAELSGFLAKVSGSYNPDTQDLSLATAPGNDTGVPPRPFGQRWRDRSDALPPLASPTRIMNEAPPEDEYFYMRVWNRGGDTTSPAAINFVPGTPVSLARTGIQVTFAGTNLRTNDFWIIAARPETPNVFVPWELSHGRSPHGVRRWIAPLGIIHWPAGGGGLVVEDDCRPTFPPLTRLRGCCTYTVGDGVTTFGHFNSIQEAVNALPAKGGEICLLPGFHRANVQIQDLHDIHIHGCGIHTHITPTLATPNDPIFHILDSRNIEISSVDLFTPQGNAILVEGLNPAGVAEIEIVHCRIIAGISCIVVANGASIGIRYCRLRVIDRIGALEAILVHAEGSWIERNDLGVVPAERTPPGDGDDEPEPPEDPCADPGDILMNPGFVVHYIDLVFTADLQLPPTGTYDAIGGIRIAAGSERITILENVINGGAGNGITLGGGLTLAVLNEPVPGGGLGHQVVTNSPGFIRGQVGLLGASVDDIIFSFQRSDGSGLQYFATSANDGVFYVLDHSITPGSYRMNIHTPGYVIAKVSTGPGGVPVPSTMLIITIRPVEDRVVQSLTIEEVRIQRNDILHMGLSGIGSIGLRPTGDNIPVPVSGRPVILEQFGTIVFQLEIDGNHIRRCVRNPFDQAMLAVAAIRGFGGISLGLCDEVVISTNRLEQNGRSHLDPIVGIFAALVDHIEIHDNRIENNGPFDLTSVQLSLRAGVRGGMVLRALARFDHMTEIDAADNLAALDQPAARIYDNVVRQPVGQALQLAALGPVTVQNNFLTSSRTGLSFFEVLAGVVLIWNEGAREFLSPVAGAVTQAPAIPTTPDGKTLYSDNQVRFGQQGRSFCGQLLITSGDLSYDSNQADYLGPGLSFGHNSSMFVNTIILTDTVRATDSRFKEGPLVQTAPVLSLVSSGTTFNITSQNQGDHCIFAFGGGMVDTPNQVLINTFCRDFGPGISDTLVSNGFISRRG